MRKPKLTSVFSMTSRSHGMLARKALPASDFFQLGRIIVKLDGLTGSADVELGLWKVSVLTTKLQR